MDDKAISVRRLLAWLWSDHLRGRAVWLALALIFMALEGAAVGGLTYLIKPMFDGIYPGADPATVYWIAGSVAGVFALRALAGFAQRVILYRQSEEVAAVMQETALAHALTLDQSFFHTNSPGALITRISGDTTALKSLWPPIIQALGRDSFTLVAILTVALMTDWIWTVIAVVGVPIMLAPLASLQRSVRRTTRHTRQESAVLATRLDEAFHGIRTLQLTGTEPQELGRFRASLARYLSAQRRAQTASAGIPALIDIVAALGFAGVMLYGGGQIIAGDKTLGEFMSFFTGMALIFEPLRRLGGVSALWGQARVSLERLRALLDLRPSLFSPVDPAPIQAAANGPGLELRNVTFGYGEAAVLQDVSFRAEAGKTTALVGPSGAGKTTIFQLLTRLADPADGQVLIEGQDLRGVDLRDLRRQFAVVSQDSALFDETIAHNVRLGAKDQSEPGLARALSDALALDFVRQLPQGVETRVGPRGVGLSGGQRQRIAIARAILRDAPILLLDEATSALDSQSEKLVSEALERLSKGRTTLVIAHKLSTVLQADRIVVMDKGRVVDQGTHAELLARGGLYADLYRLQFRDEGSQP